MLETIQRRKGAAGVSASALLAFTAFGPTLAGCGTNGGATGSATSNVQQAPSGNYGGGNYGTVPASRNMPQQRQGMSTGQKLAILAGGAALLYMYNRNKNKQGTGPNGQYYRSKNGRIYYRDNKGNAVYVTPPAGGIQVPAEEAERYNRAAQSGDYSMVEGMGGSGNYGAGNYGSGNMGSGMGAGSGMSTGGGNYGAAAPGPRGAGAYNGGY